MIIVEYYPSGEQSPLPNGERMYKFDTFIEFKQWVQNYVCVHCLVDFYDFNEVVPSTLEHWLDMGCGCEIGIEDQDNIIDWNALMVLPDNFDNLLK